MPETHPLSRRHIIYNLVMFQLGWFFCAYGAAQDMPWLAFLVVPPVLIWHMSHAYQKWQEVRLLLALLVLGLVLDQTLLLLGFVGFPYAGMPPGWLPPWMLMLWLLFGTTLNVTLRWARSSLWLQILFGALGGPLAYYAGQQLGAIRLPQEASLLAIGCAWAVAFPLAIALAKRFDGMVQNGIGQNGKAQAEQAREQA